MDDVRCNETMVESFVGRDTLVRVEVKKTTKQIQRFTVDIRHDAFEGFLLSKCDNGINKVGTSGRPAYPDAARSSTLGPYCEEILAMSDALGMGMY